MLFVGGVSLEGSAWLERELGSDVGETRQRRSIGDSIVPRGRDTGVSDGDVMRPKVAGKRRRAEGELAVHDCQP
jgi:hypothetical protein